MTLQTVPEIVFHTRVRNDAIGGPNPFEWKDLTTENLFAGKTIVLFALPGAFTPACSDSHLPGYEQRFEEFRAAGVDEIYCLSVNDAFVMFQFARSREIQHVTMLPDGNGEFTRLMGMLTQRYKHGMGLRSWRYSMLVRDRRIEKIFAEPGFGDEQGAGLNVSDAGTMLDYLTSSRRSS